MKKPKEESSGKKGLRAIDLRAKSMDDLKTLLAKCELELIELKRKRGFRELEDITAVGKQRKEIARIQTVMNEMRSKN
jgi:ribosomal protein L29